VFAYGSFAGLHAVVGAVALVGFWVAALSRKGGRVHRAAGKVHVFAMLAVILSAVPLTLDFLFARSTAFGLFLAYLIVLVGTSVWCGWQAIRHKRDWAKYTGAGYRILMWLNLAVGATIVGVGAVYIPVLKIPIVVVGFLGIGNFARMFAFGRRPPTDPRWWLDEHLSAMIPSGAGSHVAFLFFGLPKIVPAVAGTAVQNAAWLAPIVVAVIARAYAAHKYLAPSTKASTV
jgi:uncharacterized membrane protein